MTLRQGGGNPWINFRLLNSALNHVSWYQCSLDIVLGAIDGTTLIKIGQTLAFYVRILLMQPDYENKETCSSKGAQSNLKTIGNYSKPNLAVRWSWVSVVGD